MPFNQKPEIFWHLIIYLCIKLHYSSLISFLKSIFLRSVSHSFHCRLFIYLGFLISGIYYTKRKKNNQKNNCSQCFNIGCCLGNPFAWVLHDYVFETCLAHTALPLLCLMATREFSFVLCSAIYFRGVFEVSGSYENNQVLCWNLHTSQPIFPKLNGRESPTFFCSVNLKFEI